MKKTFQTQVLDDLFLEIYVSKRKRKPCMIWRRDTKANRSGSAYLHRKDTAYFLRALLQHKTICALLQYLPARKSNS